MCIQYYDAMSGEDVERAQSPPHIDDLPELVRSPSPRLGRPALRAGLPTSHPGVLSRLPSMSPPPPSAPSLYSGAPLRLYPSVGPPPRHRGMSPPRPGVSFTLYPGASLPARPARPPSPRLGAPPRHTGVLRPRPGAPSQGAGHPNVPSGASDAGSGSVPQNVPPVGRQHLVDSRQHLVESRQRLIESRQRLVAAQYQPAFHPGTILNPVWISTARVGLGIGARADIRPLEPFRQNPTEDPAWAGAWAWGISRLTRWGRAMAPRSDRPVSPHYDDGQCDDYDWGAAISTYASLDLEQDDVMPGLVGLGGLVGLDDVASEVSSKDGHVEREEVVEE